MQHIVLTAEQIQILSEAGRKVEVRDEKGRTVAHLTPLDPADIEAIERWKQQRNRPREPGIPSELVQKHLQRLSETRQSEGLDEAKMLALLKRMQAGVHH